MLGKDQMKRSVQIIIAMCCVQLAGGICDGSESRTNMTSNLDVLAPSPEVFQRWTKDHSYYALLEIVDAYIDPRTHKATKADVRRYIGKGDDTKGYYPNSGPNLWVFPSSRRVPYGSYLIIEFDSHQKVKKVDWVSE